ncbi:hypothetical protein E3V39_06915 [Gammaproteobacteria bacterium LSUCC0112]|nr:hypothetical protein E3V39_06915 [Gammaproteobacteria bacterium LSUCC0112]
MSLVNDMLRDLDARRRDTPVGGLGADKLVPATDRDPVKKRKAPRVIVALTCLVLTAVLAFLLASVPQNEGQLVLTSPVATNTTNAVVTQPSGISEVAGTAATNAVAANTDITVSADTTTGALTQLELRLQQLEEQNRALLEAQQREEQLQLLQAQPIIVQQPANVPGNQFTTTQSSVGNRGQAETPLINQDWADAPALPADSANGLTTDMSATTATTRSPRELSLAERDRQQVQLALQQWASGQQLAAFQTLDAFSYQNPDAHNSRETLAKLLIQQGETERAMQAIELGLAIAPNQNGYRKLKARLLLQSGAAIDAVNTLVVSVPSIVSDTEYHDLLASAYLASQQHENAAATYQALLQQDATEGRWWYGLAASLDALGRTSDALTAYDRALQQSSLNPRLRQVSQQRSQAIRQSETTW